MKWLDIGIIQSDGRVFEPDSVLIPAKSAVTFPSVTCTNLNSEDKIYPLEINAKIKLITFSFKQYGANLVKSWYDPFYDHFVIDQDVQVDAGNKSLAQATRNIDVVELCFVEYAFLSFAKTVFVNGLKSHVPPDRHGNVGFCFGGVQVYKFLCFFLF